MSDQTGIEWCDSTFNPWLGCTKISPACDHCYAEKLVDSRLHKAKWGAGQPRVRTSAANWRKPLQWNARRFMACGVCGWRGECEAELIGCRACASSDQMDDVRRRVFCASLADVFDNEVPIEWLADLLDLIRRTPNLDWLLLTKRIGNVQKRLLEAANTGSSEDGLTSSKPDDSFGHCVAYDWAQHRSPPPNVWLGATICNQAEADRDIPKLLATPARVRFLSIEPMLGAIDLSKFTPVDGDWNPRAADVGAMLGLDWVIAGGESGPHARPSHPDWFRSLRDQCAAANVPFLFKQHGEWLATDFCDDDMAMLPSKRTVYVRPDGSFHDGSEGIDFFGGDERETAWVGKKAAGRLLDGIEHNGFPA